MRNQHVQQTNGSELRPAYRMRKCNKRRGSFNKPWSEAEYNSGNRNNRQRGLSKTPGICNGKRQRHRVHN